MKYTLEKIFKEFGQFDKIVTLSFFPDSPSFFEYPDLMTGMFCYSPKERLKSEELSLGENKTYGFIRFKEILNEINENQKTYLLRIGINCEFISNIFTLKGFNQENKFHSEQRRELPKPNIIEIDIEDNFDYDSMFINLNKRKIQDGYKLTPEELAEYNGISLNFKEQEIYDSEFYKSKTEKLERLVRKHFLKSRLRHKHANDKEIEELNNIENQELIHKIIVLQKEIKRAGVGIKNFDIIRPKIEKLFPFLLEFTEKKLTNGKIPVWLSFERFLHIFLEHVHETNLGENFKDKTKFQYLINDIYRLIENVLVSIDDEIQNHFLTKPDKNFKRHGELAIYYNGDYYVIAINPSGLLMTFYKRQ